MVFQNLDWGWGGGGRYIHESVFILLEFFLNFCERGRYQGDAARSQFSYRHLEIWTFDHRHFSCCVAIQSLLASCWWLRKWSTWHRPSLNPKSQATFSHPKARISSRVVVRDGGGGGGCKCTITYGPVCCTV